MGILVRCPNGHTLNVSTTLAGKRGRCPHCQTAVDVPRQESSLRTATRLDPEPEAETRSSASTPGPAGASPSAANADGERVWYVLHPTGGQTGPLTEREFQSSQSEGRITPECLLWRQGWAEWRPLPALTLPVATPVAAVPTAVPTVAMPQAGLPQALPVTPTEGATASGAYPRAGRRRRKTAWLMVASILLLLCLMALVPVLFHVLNRL